MKKITIILAASGVIVAGAMLACNTAEKPSGNKEGLNEAAAPLSNDSLIKRGQYLVHIMGCNDCHTPLIMTAQGPARDTSRLLSGHPAGMQLPPADAEHTKGWILTSMSGTAVTGPWGTSFAANITSDETGIGNWSEAQFIKSIREGKLKGMDNTRPLLPPMPWQGYAKATDEDLKAIFAYLKSTKPIENRVPAPVPPQSL